ncbi:MAG: hypothetical protein DRH17_13500 [Deltaproteobacteria bacterium]|nr:MAG: hypothetical protein DRH17_13500 [Deltaproteobacteria bacterium]
MHTRFLHKLISQIFCHIFVIDLRDYSNRPKAQGVRHKIKIVSSVAYGRAPCALSLEPHD